MSIFNPFFIYRICTLYLQGRRSGITEISRDYDQIAPEFRSLWERKMGSCTLRMLDILNWKPGATVLDIGCGAGFMMEHALKRGAGSVTGIDCSSAMLKIAENRIKSENVFLLHGDALSLIRKMPSSRFDLITCGFSWEYMNPGKILPEIRRMLKPGGSFGLITNRRGTIPEIELAYLKLLASRPEHIIRVCNINLRLPRGYQELRRQFNHHDLIFFRGWNGCRRFSFKDSRAAADWAVHCGALAGMLELYDTGDLQADLANYLDLCEDFHVTHKFSVATGTRC